MTPSEFANKIRTKYPGQYDDLSDTDLTSKILSKHPQYNDMVYNANQFAQPEQNLAKKALQYGAQSTLNVGGEALDALKSGYQTLKTVGSDIMNPSQIPADVATSVMKGNMPDIASGLGKGITSFVKHP